MNGIVEIGGPEQFRFDELIRLGLSARKDPREVVADPHARYFGTELSERSLVPGDNAQLGETRFEDWLSRSAGQIPQTPQRATAASIKMKSILAAFPRLEMKRRFADSVCRIVNTKPQTTYDNFAGDFGGAFCARLQAAVYGGFPDGRSLRGVGGLTCITT